MRVSTLIKSLQELDKNANIEFYEQGKKCDFYSLDITHDSILRDTGYSKKNQEVKLTIISR